MFSNTKLQGFYLSLGLFFYLPACKTDKITINDGLKVSHFPFLYLSMNSKACIQQAFVVTVSLEAIVTLDIFYK